jgi:transcriptional regulator with XRE-family HTH domain
MKDRILEFLRAENKSSAQFAEEIGVQPSGISHILSGRNNPSLDFTLKMLDRYKFLSTDWLLFGKGTMYKEGKSQSLFDQSFIEPEINFNQTESKQPEKLSTSSLQSEKSEKPASINKPAVERIVWFYNDNSFEEYYPNKQTHVNS